VYLPTLGLLNEAAAELDPACEMRSKPRKRFPIKPGSSCRVGQGVSIVIATGNATVGSHSTAVLTAPRLSSRDNYRLRRAEPVSTFREPTGGDLE